MNKIKKMCAIILTLLILTSCTKAQGNKEISNVETTSNVVQQGNIISSKDDNKNNPVYSDNSYFGQYQITEEGFSKIVMDNSIDRDYKIELDNLQKSSEFSTQGCVELEEKYTKIWDKELNNTYNKVLNKLNNKEKVKLRNSQNGWLQFHINESDFINESWNDLGLGTQGRVQLAISVKDRIRQRTLQLMEYYYMLGGEVEFLYKDINK